MAILPPFTRLLVLALLGGTLSVASVSSSASSSPSSPSLAAPICEDSLDGGITPPFNPNDVPCLLGCGTPLAVASGSLLPGAVVTSAIPYCQLNCVVATAAPAQSSAAPACYGLCHRHNEATPENIGWCMYWCVAGFSDVVASTACIPSLAYGVPVATVIGGETVTYQEFTQPAAWKSWYATETILPKKTTTTPSTAASGSSQGGTMFMSTHARPTKEATSSTTATITVASASITSSRTVTTEPQTTSVSSEAENGQSGGASARTGSADTSASLLSVHVVPWWTYATSLLCMGIILSSI